MKKVISLNLTVFFVLGFFAIPIPATNAEITIDFEYFPGVDGILGTADDVPTPNCPGGICFPLSNELSSLGLTFSSGTLFQGNWFPGSSANNHYISSSPLNVTLSVPVFGISIESYSFWTSVLTAFDTLDNVIATVVLTNPDEGVNLSLGTLSLSTNQAIRRFTVVAQSGPNHILNLDNLILNTANPVAVSTIPEWGMIILIGLLGMLSIYFLRSQQSVR